MNKEYLIIIKKVEKIINKYGIPLYLKKWKTPTIPDNFDSYDDFYNFLNAFCKSYHKHTHFSSKSIKNIVKTKESDNKDRPMPNLDWNSKNKIGTIKFYHFINGYVQKENTRDTKKLVTLVRSTLKSWLNNNNDIKGLIIDLREHSGGNMWPHVEALQDILGTTSLLSFGNIKTKFTDKKWINIENGKVSFNQKFIGTDMAFDKPIAILVSNKTESSGEFIASIFCGRDNVKLFGDKTNKTGGYLSANDGPILLNDDLSLWLTVSLLTTVDGFFHTNEYLSVKKIDKYIKTTCKKWIKSAYNK